MCLPSIRCCSFFVVGVVIFGEGGFIFVARHKSGQSYPFLNERAVGIWNYFAISLASPTLFS